MSPRIFPAILLTISLAAKSMSAAPQLAQLSPYALAPGKTVELMLQGQQLLSPRSLWTTFAARTEFVAPADDAGKKGEKLLCRVTVPRGEQVGIGALRLVTADGVSNPMLVVLDDLPTATEATDNHTVAQAQTLQLPVAVDGQCDAVQEDFYRFHANAGERLSFEVVSQRLGARLDSVLRLFKSDGTEIKRFDDAAGSGGDSRFAHTFDTTGDCFLAVSDVRHLGGGDYRYRLRIGSFPLVAAAFPLGGRGGAIVSFAATGDGIDPESKLHIELPEIHGGRQVAYVGVPSPYARGSGWFPVEVASKDETIEQEPNNTVAEANAIQFPNIVNGKLAEPGDHDCFRFKARKGQRVHAVAKTRELGSACDVFLTLLKADGSKLAEARQERQTILDADIPEDGDYIVQVDDLLVAGSPSQSRTYRIELDETYPGFRLTAEQPQYNAPQGGTFTVKVTADRRGYSGPIELAVEGLGPEVVLAGDKFEGGETLLKITLPASIAAGEMRLAKIVGKAKVGEETVEVAASQREPLRTLFPSTMTLPPQLVDSVAIGVSPPFPPFFDVAIPGNEVYFPQLVGASSFDISINRTNAAFKDAVSFSLEGLPKEITAKVEPVGDGLKAARVSLSGPADFAEGEFSLRIVGTGIFQDQTHKAILDNVKLRVTKPLVVSVAMLGPIVAGAQQQAEVNLQRFGSDPQPVRLQVGDGPTGLSAPISVNVPADTAQVKFPLTAEAAAPAGKFQNLVVVATTVVKGQNITVHSKPAPVEIQPAPAK